MFNRKKVKRLKCKNQLLQNEAERNRNLITHKYSVIQRLRTRNKKLHEKIKLLQWQIENPPKLKKGEELKGGIITDIKLFEPDLSDRLGAVLKYVLQGLFNSNEVEKQKILEECVTDTTRTYIYQITIPAIEGQPETKQEFKENKLQLT